MKKRCTKCNLEKSINLFPKRKDSKDGYNCRCKVCCSTIAYANKIRRQTSDAGYIKSRTSSLNDASGRRNGKAGKIISSSTPILVSEILLLIQNSNKQCYYCGIDLDLRSLVFDHKLPLSKNGTHTVANLAISCKHCNNLKGTMTDLEFNHFLKSYISRFNFGNTEPS